MVLAAFIVGCGEPAPTHPMADPTRQPHPYEVFAYRFLDHFAVTFSGTGGANFGSPQHDCIIVSVVRVLGVGIIASNADYNELHRRLRQAETL